MVTTYKLDKAYLSLVEEPQLRLFEDEFRIRKDKFIDIKFEQRGYTVNDKAEEVVASTTQTIGCFSGAGGFDIGGPIGGE